MYMPSKEELLEAYADVEYILKYNKMQRGDDTQFYHWPDEMPTIRAPTNHFSAINYISSNEMFLKMSVSYAQALMQENDQNTTLALDKKKYLESWSNAIKIYEAVEMLQKISPDWTNYYHEFDSWEPMLMEGMDR